MFKYFLQFIALGLLIGAPVIMAQSPVPAGAVVDKIAAGFQFVEGPLWHPDGFLIFSDIPASTVYKWDPATGNTSVFHKPSGNSNGLSLDLQGNVLLCQHGKRRVARRSSDGSESAVAETYQGKKLNSPNDLTVKKDGNIFFTDPPYGINSSQEELKFYGIFRYSPAGELVLLDKSLNRPNGICFSPDESKLYVNDSQALKIYVWDVQADLSIANKTLFYSMTGGGAADGMKTDTEGRLYSSGPGGVWIFSPDKKVIDKIAVPETVTNLNWGDTDYQTLFITAGVSVYSIRLNAVGAAVSAETDLMPQGFELAQNYPNPFNPNTTIAFTLSQATDIFAAVYNERGQQVYELTRHRYLPGRHQLAWTARDEQGKLLPSGVYFCRFEAEEQVQVRKMIYIR
ncbi:MAG: T9SS C-terminal target domain-containing protein [Calditrichaeota bacterium]|nr:MAG: T9SS C-terminal target domain-containing protein [Calditrichota bacterium]